MTDTVENSDATPSPSASTVTGSATPPAKKPRGRPPKLAVTETPQQTIDRLEAQLQQAREAKKIAEQQRDAIIGKVVVAHALAHADYRHQLAALLRDEVKSKADLAAIAELLT
jgi:hypothetical protein